MILLQGRSLKLFRVCIRKIVLLQGFLIIVLSACGSESNTTATIDIPAIQTVAHQTVIADMEKIATANAQTATPKLTSTLIPRPSSTVIPTTTALKLKGAEVSYDGISFTVDPILGDVVFMSRILEPPGYTKFSFAMEQPCREVGCITVYRVEAFRDYPFGDYIIDELQAVIETGSHEYFPAWGSAILLRSKTQHIRFQNGAGIRAAVMRAQNGYFANNEALIYDFHGLSSDGQYYVEVQYPIDAPILLSTYDPAENTNKGAIPVPELPDEDPFSYAIKSLMHEYNLEAQRQLELLEDASFVPDLGILDALAGSLMLDSSNGE